MGKETLYNKKSKTELKKNLKDEKFNRQTVSFYKYLRLNNLDQLRDKIYKSWDSLNILGRVYISKEGINAQISIPDSEPIPSDHEMNDRFYDIFEVNKQAIMQAIEVIEADDIDEQKRKETVAILYLMLGENNEALKRLDED